LRTASVRRTVVAALVAGACGAAAGSAQAAPQVDNLTQGTHDKTALVGGGVELAPALNQTFDAPPPADWVKPWVTPGGGAPASGGIVSVDRARLDTGVPGGAGTSVAYKATFGKEAFQHLGFGVDFDADTRWAIFSTLNTSDSIYARVNVGAGDVLQKKLDGVLPDTAHDFRIDWTTTGFVFYVDGLEVARHVVVMPVTPSALTAQASDVLAATAPNPEVPLKIDSMSVRKATAGTYTSKVFDAGSSRVASIAFTPVATTPAGTAIAYQTRTSADNVNWSAWGPASATKPARYFQYKATLTTNDVAVTPRLTKATVDFKLQTVQPSPGAGTGGGGTTNTPPADKTKPRIAIPREADVTSRGKVRMLLECPGTERFCIVGLKLKWKGKTVASKGKTIDGGDSAYITPKLSKAARRKLAKAGKLKVVVKLTVTDAAGNVKKSSKGIWLYPV
jgi:hypothetical protein